MQITTFIFFALLAVVFLILRLCNKFIKSDEKSISVSNWVLLISSYVFVGYADIRFALVLAALSVSTWFFAKHKKYISIGIIIAVLVLAYFKYTNFFIGSFAKNFGIDYSDINIILPLGISFYTFSAIGYLVDVKREKINARNLKDVALYLGYFPKITSGPIQKSQDFFDQIGRKRNVGYNTFSTGIQIFMFGLFKKIVLADRLSVFVNQVYDTPLAFSSGTVFLAAISYALQIYFDFSGYSDMAIGISAILGIKLPRNFNLPYLSHNVTEFWKRWHISLSSWLQEYLYISLGGNRKGKIRTHVNLILTMLIGGIWHGANWTYIVWGLLQGIALAAHKVWMTITKSYEKSHLVISNIISIVTTFLFTTLSWIFFRAENIHKAFQIINRIISFEDGVTQPYMWFFVSAVILVASSFIAFGKSKSKKNLLKKYNVSFVDGFYPILKLETFWGAVAFLVFCGLILCLAYTGGSPFIYGNY